MADQRGSQERSTIRSIAWQQVFPSLRLLTAIRMALNFKALLLAAVAVAGTVAGWRVLDQIFADQEPARQFADGEFGYYLLWPWERLSCRCRSTV